MENLDNEIKELVELAKSEKDAISKIEAYAFKTNCAFRYDYNTSQSINLQTISDVDKFIDITSFLLEKEFYYSKALKELDIEKDFQWLGYNIEDWISDIKHRINKVQLSTRKQELSLLEKQLNELVSPEMKRKMELEEIKNKLKKK